MKRCFWQRDERLLGVQGGKLAAQYDKESKGERNLAFKPVSRACLPQLVPQV